MGTTGQSITLANSIIGVGILAMPFCFQQCGVVLATLILLFMGLVSRLCCYFLLKSALISRRRNFEFLAFHVFGPAGKLAVEVGIIGFLMGTCIAYFVVVGDLGPQIISKMFNINQSDILRTSIMVIVSLVCVLPLGLLRNVDSLSNVSAATIGFYFCLVIKVIEEAASQLWAGDWHRRVEMWRPAGLLQCVPIFSMALFCQTQLFEIFESLPTLSLEKMCVVTKNAINICQGVYFTLGLFGYIAFCSQNISGNILMSLSPTMASDVIKLGFVMSLAFSFPLIIFPCRASLYSLLYKKVHPYQHDHIINHSIPETTFRCITVAIVAVALFISLLIPNIELVLGLVGSTIGVLICVVFPAACFVNVTFKNTNERILAKGIVILGLVILVLGTFANLQAAENQAEKYDDKITPERIDKIVEDFFEKWDKTHAIEVDNTSNKKVMPILNPVQQKDSEVQPPNPVPPESASHEKHDVEKPEKPVEIKQTVTKLQPIEPVMQKDIESHPKNVQTKLNDQKTNNVDNKVVADKPPKEDVKPPTIQGKAQEKIDLMKQQKLIETIKQHGEEQKELMKEQKEILDEIIKTKKELELNKKDDKAVDGIEAKKLAVESIQKIANVAIQSLSGVSDKPVDIQQGNKEPELEKIAQEAVQEIAKKAVESIVAIHEIKEKPKQNLEVKIPSNLNGDANKVNEIVQNVIPNQNLNLNDQLANNPILQNIMGGQPVAGNQNLQVNNLPNGANQNIPPNNLPNVPNVVNQNVQENSVPNSNQVNIHSINMNKPVLQDANKVMPINSVAQANNDPVHNIQPNNIQPVVLNANSNNAVNPANVQSENKQPLADVAKPPLVMQQLPNLVQQQPQIKPSNIVQQTEQIIQSNNINNAQQPIANMNPSLNANNEIHEPVVNGVKIEDVNVEKRQASQNIASPVQNVQSAPQTANKVEPNIAQQLLKLNEPIQDHAVKEKAEKQTLAHSHSPDEPKSYKLGEDSQLKSNMQKNIAENLPLPIAMNGKALAQNQNSNEERPKRDLLQVSEMNGLDGARERKEISDTQVEERQKEGVIDCTKISSLQPTDKERCGILLNNHKIEKRSAEILPSNVDLNNVLERKNLPFDSILHVRSLKSYDKR